MRSGGGSSALTGITTFLVLAFLLPGIVYVAAIAVLFAPEDLESIVPAIELRLDVAAGAVVVLGLLLSSLVFTVEIVLRFLLGVVAALFPRRRRRPFGGYVDVIFRADRRKELAWYFWQVWGQRIMHLNVFGGLAIIYAVYRWSIGDWGEWSWRDGAVGIVIASNCVLYGLFSSWHEGMMQTLRDELANPPPVAGGPGAPEC